MHALVHRDDSCLKDELKAPPEEAPDSLISVTYMSGSWLRTRSCTVQWYMTVTAPLQTPRPHTVLIVVDGVEDLLSTGVQGNQGLGPGATQRRTAKGNSSPNVSSCDHRRWEGQACG